MKLLSLKVSAPLWLRRSAPTFSPPQSQTSCLEIAWMFAYATWNRYCGKRAKCAWSFRWSSVRDTFPEHKRLGMRERGGLSTRTACPTHRESHPWFEILKAVPGMTFHLPLTWTLVLNLHPSRAFRTQSTFSTCRTTDSMRSE